MHPAGEEALVRGLGTRQLAAGIINTTIGAGIFLLPGLVYESLGPAAPIAFLVCGAAMALIVTAFAVAGSRVSLTGGLFAYVETAFGPYLGFLAGILQWLTFLLAVSSVASALLDQIGAFVPALGALGKMSILAVMLLSLAAINVRGLSSGARTIEVFTVAKLLTLMLFVAVGAFFIQPSTLAWPGLPGGDAIGRAVLLLIFAFVGVEVALTPSGEVREPARTVPRAIYLALAVTTLLYIAVQVVTQGVLGPDLAQHAQAPIAEASSRFLGATGRTLILLGTMCSMFGYLCGDMLSSPRNLFAFGRDRFIPAVFARIHPKHHTPHVAIWTHALLVFAIATNTTFQRLAIFSNVGTLTLFLLCCAAAVELVRRDIRAGGIPFAIPGARYVPIAAAAVILWILSNATWEELGVTALVLIIASIIYAVRLRGRAAVGIERAIADV